MEKVKFIKIILFTSIVTGLIIAATFIGASIYWAKTIDEAKTQDVPKPPQTLEEATRGSDKKDADKKELVAIYGEYNNPSYQIYKYNLNTDSKELIYSQNARPNFAWPVIGKFDDDTLYILNDLELTLIDLNGNKVTRKFNPTGRIGQFSFSPDASKVLFHSYPSGVTTAVIKNLETGRELTIKPIGKSQTSGCSIIGWSEDSSKVYCRLSGSEFYLDVYLIDADTGEIQNIGPRGSLFYPNTNVSINFVVKENDGPIVAIEVTNHNKNTKKTVVETENSIKFVDFDPETNELTFVENNIAYKIDITDPEKPREKVAELNYKNEATIIAAEGNFAAIEEFADVTKGSPYIDNIYILNLETKKSIKLLEEPRSQSPTNNFIGFFNNQEEKATLKTQPEPKTLTYLISEEDESKYCNGGDMDSEGYKKTITKEIITDIPIDTMTKSELAKATAVAATAGQCQDVLKQIDFRVEGDTVYIAPIDGWAGISITMCSCDPQVEVNLLRIPGINKVVHESMLDQINIKQQTADWKTCTNIKYGYEVKYPPNWNIYRVGPPEASESICDENLGAFGFSPNIYLDDQPKIVIVVSTPQELEETIYEGSKSLDDYFAKNPAILKAQQVIKESTLDNERLVWLSGGSLLVFHNSFLFEFTNIKNVGDDTLNLIFENFKFIK